MTRVNDAMRQAAATANELSAPDADQSFEFVVSEGGADASSFPKDRAAAAPKPTAIVVQQPRSRVQPVERIPRTSSDDVQVTDLLFALYRRRWLILAVIAAAVGGAVFYNSSVTPIYLARTKLVIEPSYPQVVTFRPVESEDPSRIEYLQTQVEVLRSRTLARLALEKLTLLSKDPGQQRGQISALVGNLRVTPVTLSRLVDVGFSSPDPEYAARVANGVAEAYVEQNLDSRGRASREASQWLTERLADLRKQVDASEGALQQFREQTDDAISLEDRQSIVGQKLAQLNAAVTSARTRRIEQEALYSQLRAIEQSGAPLDTYPPIVSNLFIQGLKAELAALQRERAGFAKTLGPLHPEMIRVDTAMTGAERRLNTEIGKVVDGIRNDFRAAQANERGLIAALEEQKKDVMALNRDAIGYGTLRRDAASTQQIFESLLQRVKEADLTGELQANNIRILDRAEVPRAPIWPRTQLNLIVAFLAGCVVAVGLALGLQYLRPRLKTPDEVGDSLGLPLLGITPKIAGLKGALDGGSGEAFPAGFREAFRGIRARILLSPISAGVRTLAVTSTSTGEGKTLVASNLAISMALGGRRVLLVDGDMRRSRVHTIFGVPRSPGLSDVMAGAVNARSAIRPSAIEGLSILPAGVLPGSASDLLETVRFQQLIDGLSDAFDMVVIDTPPVMAVADASIIANAASGVLFVVGAGATNRDVAQVAIQRLAAAQAQLIGVVLNKADMDGRSEDYYPYYQREDEEYYEQPEPTVQMRGAAASMTE